MAIEQPTHIRRILGNRSMEMTEPNPFDHAAIVRITREDSAALIAEIRANWSNSPQCPDMYEAAARASRRISAIHAALSKAKGEVA
ncbi:hypothetical protein V5F77_05340 [Xanthobacter sp. DSM 24535]|uniref:hypothetical protein n=1 Tax=Roseixanthobacter psychrophilus TaxID=3119917 RepID=UPI00372B281D